MYDITNPSATPILVTPTEDYRLFIRYVREHRYLLGVETGREHSTLEAYKSWKAKGLNDLYRSKIHTTLEEL